ncbi:hypothetical protein FBEOM_5874 [Fusarium beomiforme]|uniref:Uncharacterized protein n=1 Tax=Fusarium beomiforme TaxID=44412 RepID=A0A9P5ALR7_9HYPO|nr:hypothetical protein FBEOM_5874 [Fusarium beomiforme]
MDTRQDDSYRVKKNRRRGRGGKKRVEASEQNYGAQKENRAPTECDTSGDESSESSERDVYHSPVRRNEALQVNPTDFHDCRPLVMTYNLLRVLPTVEIRGEPSLSIRNPRETGPQTDICARVPGFFNHWASRVSCYDSVDDL